MANEIVLQWDPSSTPVSGYNVYRGTLPGNEGPVPLNGNTLVMVAGAMLLSSVAASVSGSAVYTGSIAGGAGNAWAGFTFVISGFAGANNNGRFACTASTATTLTLSNDSATAESHGALAQQVPQFTDLGVFPGKVYSYEVTSVVGGVQSADSIGILSAAIPFDATPIAPFQGGLDGFVVLAATAITNTGDTNASGDVGVYPGTSITGFGPPSAISGVFHIADFVSAAGQAAAQNLYNSLQIASSPSVTPIVADLGGTTLAPGIYNSGSSIGLTGDLILDAGGNPNATWIFQAGSSLTVAGNVILVNGAQASNVFWQVGSSASIAANNQFSGIIVAQASITVAAGANISGRLFALAGAITLSGDNITFFLQVPFAGAWQPNTQYGLGVAIFDCASDSFQQVVVAGTSGATLPAFSNVPLTLTAGSGTVVWETVTLENAFIVLATPLSPPNIPPAPPAAPTGLFIEFEN